MVSPRFRGLVIVEDEPSELSYNPHILPSLSLKVVSERELGCCKC